MILNSYCIITLLEIIIIIIDNNYNYHNLYYFKNNFNLCLFKYKI